MYNDCLQINSNNTAFQGLTVKMVYDNEGSQEIHIIVGDAGTSSFGVSN